MATELHHLRHNIPSDVRFLQTLEQKKQKNSKRIEPNSFFQLLKEASSTKISETKDNQQAILEENLKRIVLVGERLQKAPSHATLFEYRNLIQAFLEKNLNGLYQVEESLGRINYGTGQKKKYIMLRLIDQKLEELIRLVLENQKANLGILKRVEKINGLLVDLIS